MVERLPIPEPVEENVESLFEILGGPQPETPQPGGDSDDGPAYRPEYTPDHMDAIAPEEPGHAAEVGRGDADEHAEPSAFGFTQPVTGTQKQKQEKQKTSVQITLQMTDYVQQAVDHYKRLAKVDKLKPSKTPYCPEGSLVAANDEEQGEVSNLLHPNEEPLGC